MVLMAWTLCSTQIYKRIERRVQRLTVPTDDVVQVLQKKTKNKKPKKNRHANF